MKAWKAELKRTQAEAVKAEKKPELVIVPELPLSILFREAENDEDTQILDLHGLSKTEAWDQAQTFLRKQLASGRRAAKLMHGNGTGALHAMLEMKLRRQSWIEAFRDSQRSGGESGSVIVVLF